MARTLSRSPSLAGTRSAARAAGQAPRSPWRWAWLGAAIGSLPALLYFAPARWLGTAVETATQGHLQWSDVRGSLWTGSAQWVLTGGIGSQDRVALPGRFHWQLRPSWSGLSLALQADCCTNAASPLQIKVLPRWGGGELQVANGQSQWPANTTIGLGAPWNTLQPQGQLLLRTEALNVQWISGRTRVLGQLQLEAHDLSSQLTTLRPMGSYRFTINGGDAPTLSVTTLQGPLQVQGQGQWAGDRLRFSGEAYADPGREEALSNLLNLMGRRQGARSLITVG